MTEDPTLAAQETAPALFTAADLIAESIPTADTFTIPLTRGRSIVVRNLHSTMEREALQKRAEQFYRLCKDGRVPAPWKEYLPISEQTALMIRELTDMVVEPPFSDLEALRLAHDAGMMLGLIHGRIMLQVAKTLPLAEAEALDDAKND